MTAECPHCFCSQPDGLLCSEDTGKLETMFAAVPALVAQLDVAASKQARLSSSSKSGKGVARELSPVNWGAVAARDELLVQVAMWGGDIDAVRRHPQADEILRGVGKATKNAYRVIDRMQERVYLGQCLFEADDLTCHAELWAKPGAGQVGCSQCEITDEVAERRRWMLGRMRDMLFTPAEAARVMGEIGGVVVTEARIRGYLHRGKRLAYRAPVDAKRFRLGDLLDVVMDESERRSA